MILLSELGGDAANLALRSLASLARRKVTAAKLAFRGKPIQTSRALACCHDITTILTVRLRYASRAGSNTDVS